MCLHFLVPLLMLLPLMGKSLLVPQDLDPVSSLGAILEFPQTGTST